MTQQTTTNTRVRRTGDSSEPPRSRRSSDPWRSASAATVHAYTYGISYVAAPGETNDLNIHIDWWNQSGFYVDDPGAVIAVSGSCRSVDIHHAYCDTHQESPGGPVPSHAPELALGVHPAG